LLLLVLLLQELLLAHLLLLLWLLLLLLVHKDRLRELLPRVHQPLVLPELALLEPLGVEGRAPGCWVGRRNEKLGFGHEVVG